MSSVLGGTARVIAVMAVVSCGGHRREVATGHDGDRTGPPIPADDAAIATKLRDPAALDHVRGFAVDETVFDTRELTDAIREKEPLHLTTVSLGGVSLCTIDETSPEALNRLVDWVGLFPKSAKDHFVYSRSFENGAIKGWMVTAVSNAPIVDDGDFGRVVHKDAALNTKQLDIAFSAPALIRMKTLPPDIQRVMFLYDGTDVLTTVLLDDLRKHSDPVVTLATFSK